MKNIMKFAGHEFLENFRPMRPCGRSYFVPSWSQSFQELSIRGSSAQQDHSYTNLQIHLYCFNNMAKLHSSPSNKNLRAHQRAQPHYSNTHTSPREAWLCHRMHITASVAGYEACLRGVVICMGLSGLDRRNPGQRGNTEDYSKPGACVEVRTLNGPAAYSLGRCDLLISWSTPN